MYKNLTGDNGKTDVFKMLTYWPVLIFGAGDELDALPLLEGSLYPAAGGHLKQTR